MARYGLRFKGVRLKNRQDCTENYCSLCEILCRSKDKSGSGEKAKNLKETEPFREILPPS